MSLLEWVRVAEDAREQQDDERVATGLESLRMAVGELVPLIGSRSSPSTARSGRATRSGPPAGGSRREIRGRRLRPQCSATWWRD